MVSEEFMKWFNQTEFMVAAFPEHSIFLLPYTYYKMNGTPAEAMEYVTTREYDCCQLFWQVGSDIQDVLVVAAYNKSKSSEWEFSDKANGYMLRIQDWRKEYERKRVEFEERKRLETLSSVTK